MRRCIIIGGGDCTASILKSNINSDDFVICADGGYNIAQECGLVPDLLIGDFDSINFLPKNIETITLPVEKDVTDSVAAFNEGVKAGFKSFLLLGGTGGRFEHTFANISLMAKASKNNVDFTMIDDKHIFRSITDSNIRITQKDNQQISVFAYGDMAYGVNLKGLYYPLSDYTLDPFDCALSTSNHIVDEFCEVSVKDGTLVIVETQL